uniref:HMG box domain-containing protein n=1 Tax=Timema tahoe TaxID=61484 RepID=A0A7R9IQD1_9NEOP|nr:unnamed protein product [Timema tahoe]
MQALFEFQQTPDSASRDPMVQSLSHVNVKSATVSRQFISAVFSHDLEVTGVSRSGRVRKKSSKLMDFESPDEIDNRYKRKGEPLMPVSSGQPQQGTPQRGRKPLPLLGSYLDQPHQINIKMESQTGLSDSEDQADDYGVKMEPGSSESDSELGMLQGGDDDSSMDSIGSEDDDDMDDDGMMMDDQGGSRDIPDNTPSQAQSLYMLEKSSKKKLIIKDGKIIGRMKAQRKDKGKTRFTAYMLWAKEIRQEIARVNPEMDFSTMSKRLGELWATVPNNEKYSALVSFLRTCTGRATHPLYCLDRSTVHVLEAVRDEFTSIVPKRTPASIGSRDGHYPSSLHAPMGSPCFSHWTRPGSSGGYLIRLVSLGQSVVTHLGAPPIRKSLLNCLMLRKSNLFNPLSLSPITIPPTAIHVAGTSSCSTATHVAGTSFRSIVNNVAGTSFRSTNWKRRAKRLAVKGTRETPSSIDTTRWKAPPSRSKFINKLGGRAPPVSKAPTSVGVSTSPTDTKLTKVESVVGPGLYKVVGTQPVDVAAHLKLLGESLSIIGERLKEHDGQIAVSGSISVLLDSFLCAVGPLICLTQTESQTNGCSQETLNKILDNIAYFMPGL